MGQGGVGGGPGRVRTPAVGATEGWGRVQKASHPRGRWARFVRTPAIVPALALVVAGVVVPAGPASSASPTPAFVQQVSARTAATAKQCRRDRRRARLVGGSTGRRGRRLELLRLDASSVTDSAGNTYTELCTSRRPTTPSSACGRLPSPSGGGTKPTVTAKTATGRRHRHQRRRVLGSVDRRRRVASST